MTIIYRDSAHLSGTAGDFDKGTELGLHRAEHLVSLVGKDYFIKLFDHLAGGEFT